MGQIIDRSEIPAKVAELRRQGKKIVTTNGCFDILHVGHLRCLKAARAFGDVLILGLNSDRSVKRIKGESRPLNSEADRAEILSSLNCVDYVMIFSEDTPVEFLKLVKPDVHVKGGDYKPENLEETPVVEGLGGRIEIVNLVPEKSTTSLIEKIQTN